MRTRISVPRGRTRISAAAPMRTRIAAAAVAACLALPWSAAPARADNPMGYRLVSQEDAASLPHNGGALGMDIERAQHITDDALAFDIIRVKDVRRGSPGAQAGFKPGDQIIAVDGRVFASLVAFGGYVGSLPPGTQIKVDLIPDGGGPKQAQRLVATVGAAGHAAPAGLSTGTKVAIGIGAAALFGCYELGCFSHRTAGQAAPYPGQPPQAPAPGGYPASGYSPQASTPGGYPMQGGNQSPQ